MTAAHPFARTDRSALGIWWWTTDHWLLAAVAGLIFLGVALSFGTSPAAAARLGLDDPFHFAVRQCVFAAIGRGPGAERLADVAARRAPRRLLRLRRRDRW